MLDYHLHLWPHSDRATPANLDQVAAYCDQARAAGVTEVAVTEHLFRFVQADAILGGFWDDEPDSPVLRRSMAEYWTFHATADLDHYVDTVLEAKRQGLPVVLGLEVDHYRGRMDKVAALLDGYPFDVLLGSVHWVGAWRFDDLDDAPSMAEWDVRAVDAAWDAYTASIEELAATGACDVLAHPDLVKVAGFRPEHPAEWWDRLVEAAAASGMAAEVSSAGWRKPVGEQYPGQGLLARLRARDVPLTTASDAHRLDHVADRSADLHRVLSAAGVDRLQAYRRRQGFAVPLGPAPPGPDGLDGPDGPAGVPSPLSSGEPGRPSAPPALS